MKYSHICRGKWKNVIVNFGDFHGFLAFYGIIEKYIKSTGFDDVVYQASLCSPDLINAVLTGKHYNQCWCRGPWKFLQNNEEIIY